MRHKYRLAFFQNRDHPYITSANDCVGESRKLSALLTFSAVFMLIRRVGGVQKGQKYADVI